MKEELIDAREMQSVSFKQGYIYALKDILDIDFSEMKV